MKEESKDNLMVTIQCLAYNHKPYIRQCLDGFVMQKTNFRFEAIVHDDASTDGTASIIREYAEKYPNIIKPIFETENQYSKRDGSIGRIMKEHTHGKYIAMCEGDDYWTDSNKLQRQIDFLEREASYSFVCHRYNILEQNTGKYLKEYAYNYYKKDENLEITLDLYAKTWVTQIMSTVIRTDIYNKIIPKIKQYKYSRDVHIFYHLLKEGKGMSLNCNMGVYRWHDGGVASPLRADKRYMLAYEIYKELYEKNKDNIIKYKLVYNICNYVKSVPMSSTSYSLFKEGLKLASTIKMKIRLFISAFTPIYLYNILASIHKWIHRRSIILNS